MYIPRLFARLSENRGDTVKARAEVGGHDPRGNCFTSTPGLSRPASIQNLQDWPRDPEKIHCHFEKTVE